MAEAHQLASSSKQPRRILFYSRLSIDPVHWLPIGPFERVVGSILTAAVSLAYRHSVERVLFPRDRLENISVAKLVA